ncbi:DNA gyrase subunit A [Thermodesulfatator autotrophicus]|uniref:DNA gyrase subunit A n=1 Tax=Thermodesulfatator autotrophicus TaxID=1795632 RepID=A0A177E9R6_9BACT|nr:DNA gyrase subunit A [Thermodesulfatator autotrophicus]OAG27932.1 DNA gyrase subunit A [Thermodesulfatator autotrophicus]
MAEIVQVPIEEELKKSYLDYAMSVIVGRALPDVRDGLKPVQRRILYAMHELKNDWNKPYKKSARIVGDVIGKYHPHGDMAVYDTLVRMAQDFTMRYPLIDGQGNFGSMDGDAPAAMRYTEVRMAKISHELLRDIEKETVDFMPNYDNTLEEPVVLPSRIPNLLINGAAGIAVGMATNIPPHNLGEVIDALVAMIHNPDITLDELLKYIKGPDFPTGAYICGTEGIKEAYATGKGLIKLRARAHIEREGNKTAIVITELPYQVNKAKLVEKIVALAQEKKIEGISEVRDESDREGLRVVVELKREKQDFAPVILNQLYKLTPLETTFGIIMLALVNNRPEQLSLRELLGHFLAHRRNVVIRRTLYDLRKAKDRAHVIEGLLIALANLDEVIALIKASKTPAEAKEGLMKRFGLTAVQAQAILDMRLQRLTGLEQEKLKAEYEELKRQIAWFEKILAEEKVLLKVIEDELLAIKKEFADERRTEIIPKAEEFAVEDLIAEEEVVVTITHRGYIKRLPVSTYRSQRRGGRGKTGVGAGDEDVVTQLYIATTHDYFLCFTNKGKLYWLKVYDIPQAGRTAKGTSLRNLLPLSQDEKIATILPVKNFQEDQFVFFATKKGLVKKTALSAFANPRSTGIVAAAVKDGDELIAAGLTDGNKEILLVTRNGQSIRFPEEEVRAMGRTAAGVKGIELSANDEVVGLEILDPGDEASLLTVTELGYGKRTSLKEYRLQGRGGKGIIAMKLTNKTGKLVGCARVCDEDEIMLASTAGKIIRLRVKDIPVQGRATQGVRLFMMAGGERIVSLAKLAEKD